MFDDLLAANARYADDFTLAGLEPEAAKGLGLLTCMDSRIEPLAMLGLRPGDAKILRNAGARVTDDALRSLILAVEFLGVSRICVVAHTRCKMHGTTNEELRAAVEAGTGTSAADWDFLPVADRDRVLAQDVARVRECPLIPDHVVVEGFVYDVDTGRLIRPEVV